jgi:tetratricopeptide (TPR) repeat protein
MPSRKIHHDDPGVPKPDFAPIPIAGSLDEVMRRVSRIMKERQPESLDEANALMQELLQGGSIEEWRGTEPADRAQQLVYEAMDTRSAKRRTELAREALALWPDCADAHLLLANESKDIAEEHVLVLDAVEAGRRAVGGELDELVAEGLVWLALETRPYMRALERLAQVEWMMGDRQAAIARGWEMLRLNPNDNQGIRYVLLERLLSAGSLADIERLFALYPDDASATWMFGRALHLFRSRGPNADANAALAAAKRADRHVLPYMLGEREPLLEPPQYIGFGDETEAAAYAFDALELWLDAPGALEWLESKRGRPPTGRKKKRRDGRLER